MVDSIILVLTFFACTGTGLMAGLFFSFSTFIMEALGKMSFESGMTAMKSINKTILNPRFGLIFGGTTLMSLFLFISAIFNIGTNGRPYIILGSLLYIFGTFLVTIIYNVPLNNKLERSNSTKIWEDYRKKWTMWNHVRTIASIGALASFVIGFGQLFV